MDAVIRTPFHLTSAQRASCLYGGENWETRKARHLQDHFRELALKLDHLQGELTQVTTTLVDTTQVDYDGRTAEWRSLIEFDGE